MMGCQPHCSWTSLHMTTSTKLLVMMPHIHSFDIFFCFLPSPPHILLNPSFTFNNFASRHHFRLSGFEICHLEPAEPFFSQFLSSLLLFPLRVPMLEDQGCEKRQQWRQTGFNSHMMVLYEARGLRKEQKGRICGSKLAPIQHVCIWL